MVYTTLDTKTGTRKLLNKFSLNNDNFNDFFNNRFCSKFNAFQIIFPKSNYDKLII